MFRAKIKAIVAAAIVTLSIVLSAAPVQAATTIAITSPTNNATINNSSFTVTGTATPNRTITVKINGASVGTTTSNAGGTWSLDVSGQSYGPKTIEATASGQLIYVNVLSTSDFSTSRMARINTLTNTVESSFPIYLGSNQWPINWKANPSFTKAYGVAPYLNSDTVWVMDFVTGSTTSFTLPGTGQRGASIAYNTDGSEVFITDNANTDVIAYDTMTDTQIGSAIPTGTAPHSNMRRPGTNELWLDNSGSSTIEVIDMNTKAVLHTYLIAGPPNGLTFSPDGQTAYVGLDNTLAVVDANTGVTTDTITGTDTPEYLQISSDGKRVYSSHPQNTTVDVFNVETLSLESTITGLPQGTWGLALNEDNSRLYVTSPNLFGGLNGTTISVVNTANNAIIDSIVPGNGAPFIIAAAPTETGSATVTVTLAAATAAGLLADTGMNTQAILVLALALLLLGLGTIYVVLRRRETSASVK